jgi:hypothetical protein
LPVDFLSVTVAIRHGNSVVTPGQPPHPTSQPDGNRRSLTPARCLRAGTAIVLVVLCMLATTASATVPQLALTVDVSPYTGAGAPAAVTLTLHMTATVDPSDQPYATKHMSFDLDPSILTGFQPSVGCIGTQVISNSPTCTPIGDGSMQFQALGLTENAAVTAFQSTDPNTLFLLADGKTPLNIHSLLTVTKTDSPTGGSRLDIDFPPDLQQPAPGAYSTLTDFQVALRSTIAMAGCPSAPLSFATHSDFVPAFKPGDYAADATTTAPCQGAAPVAPPPFAPVPNLATAAAKKHGRVLGKLLALRSVRGMTDGTVTLTCTASCAKRKLGTATLHNPPQAALIRLHPALKITKRTRIHVTMVNAAGVTQTARFRFARRSGRLTAVSL